ncbi:MAG: potassium transporter TrkG [Oscillospiraceae bacterium]
MIAFLIKYTIIYGECEKLIQYKNQVLNQMTKLQKVKISPTQTIIAGYLGIIFFGAFLLMLPISSRAGIWTPIEDSLFTATSATCVTGLIMHDTFTYWSIFGQIVILAMIQIGGIGFMTLAISVMTLTKKKIGLKGRYTLQESVNAPQMAGIVKMTRFILLGTAIIETSGAALLALRFCPKVGFFKGIYFAIFHSISAFCNAGFDLMGESGEFSSLTSYSSDIIVNITIMALIVLGGLGFFVWSDLTKNKFKFKKLRLHSKVVITTTGVLILGGFLLIMLFEQNGSAFAGKSQTEIILGSLFQSVTPRTAGFNTLDLTLFSDASIILMIAFMIIGGSPSSTAGGFKTTTLAMLVASVYTEIRRKKSIECFKRRLSDDSLIHIICIVTLYIFLFTFSGMIISKIDMVSMKDALFECASAIGTVGLTLGITTKLSGYSHLILIGLMFFGRVGGLTLLLALRETQSINPSKMPVEKITIG